jgi:hypothetical protein
MKRASILGIAVTLVAACGASLFAQSADVTGEWDMTINSPQGTNQVLLTLKRDGDALGGTVKGQRGERPLQSVTLKGNEITLVMKAMLQGQEATFTYTGTFEKGALKGTADFAGMATGDWSAVRHVATAAPAPAPAAGGASGSPATSPAAPTGGFDISGNWIFSVETSVGSGTPAFTFKQSGEKLTGTYSGQLGQANIAGTLKGSELSFSFTAEAGGQSAQVTYTGKVLANDKMQGTVSLGGLGEGTWTGKRQ